MSFCKRNALIVGVVGFCVAAPAAVALDPDSEKRLTMPLIEDTKALGLMMRDTYRNGKFLLQKEVLEDAGDVLAATLTLPTRQISEIALRLDDVEDQFATLHRTATGK